MAFGKRRRSIRINPLFVIWILLTIALITAFIIIKLKVIAPIQLREIPLWKYLIAKRQLTEDIFHKQPEAKKITFKPDWLRFLVEIEIEKEKAIAIICGSKCYNLSQYGYIFKSQESPSKNLILITSQLEIANQSKLDRKIAYSLSKVFEFSLVKKLPLRQVEILSNRDLKFFLSAVTPSKNHLIYFLIDPNKDMTEQLQKLDKFLEYKKSMNFESIDLRITGKIYYK
jgi:hypothetical protein